MLTKRQHEGLKFIIEYVDQNGISPSYSEIGLALEMRSKAGVARIIAGLEERGFIHRTPGHARNIEILRGLPTAKREWLGTEFPPQLAMEIVRRADRDKTSPESIIIHGLRAQFGLL